MVVLGGGAVSYERGTPVATPDQICAQLRFECPKKWARCPSPSVNPPPPPLSLSVFLSLATTEYPPPSYHQEHPSSGKIKLEIYLTRVLFLGEENSSFIFPRPEGTGAVS